MTENEIDGNIWPNFPASISARETTEVIGVESARAGGKYEISADAVFEMASMTESEKARLSTWLIRQRRQGNFAPLVTLDIVEYGKKCRPSTVSERADSLLGYLVQESDAIGRKIEIGCEGENNLYGEFQFSDSPTEQTAMAWTESTTSEELSFLYRYLREQGWIEVDISGRCKVCKVRVEGYKHAGDLLVNADSTQGFVAMWFDESTDEVYSSGIEPGILDAGYKPLRIDRKEHNNKIDDEIIAEIRRSRFLVADFTEGIKGARGGVYYEAGFARGLGIPVFHTCRKDVVDRIHLDTRQFSHILWETTQGTSQESQESN